MSKEFADTKSDKLGDLKMAIALKGDELEKIVGGGARNMNKLFWDPVLATSLQKATELKVG